MSNANNTKRKEDKRKVEEQALLMEKARELSKKFRLEALFQAVARKVTNGTAEVVVGEVVRQQYCAVSYQIFARREGVDDFESSELYAGSDGLLSDDNNGAEKYSRITDEETAERCNNITLMLSVVGMCNELIKKGFIPRSPQNG